MSGAAEARSPYPGLAAFGPEDARFFFGRDRLIAEIAARLGDGSGSAGPVILVGPSGSGKSSVLRAGLVAAADQGMLPALGLTSRPIVLAPGEAPLSRLAAVVSAAAGMPAEEVARQLRADPAALATLLQSAATDRSRGTAGDGRMVLLVDQFEEIFTLCQDEAERQGFIDALCAEGKPGEPAVAVVLALRADFYRRCMAYPQLLESLRDRQVLAGPMTESELTEAIERPAQAAGCAVEPGLTGLLLDDLRAVGPDRADEDSLPLLAYALLATWLRRDGQELTRAGYSASGGVWGAVAQEAERVYGRLAAPGQDAVRRILLAMVQVSEDGRDTRRSADLEQLRSRSFPDQEDAFGQARDELAGARLITLDRGSASMTHEALLRAWPRLRDWIATERAGLLLHQRVADAAATWQRLGQDSAALYRGSLLADALTRTARDDRSALEREFLDASAGAQRAEQGAARRRTRRRQVLTAALAVLVAASLTLAGMAVRARQEALASTRTTRSVALAAQALDLRYSDPEQAALLALAAWRSAHTAVARSSLLSLQMDDYDGSLAGAGLVNSAAFSPDGRLIATASPVTSGPAVRLWDAATHRQVAAFTVGGPAGSVAFSPDGSMLAATALGKHAVRLWNPATRRLTRTLTGPGATAVAFSPDGRLLAVGEGGAAVHLWDPATGRQLRRLRGGFSQVRSLAFSPDGRLLAAGGRAGSSAHPQPRGLTRIWDIATGKLVATLPAVDANAVNSVAFSPDGRLLASATGNGRIALWSTRSHRMQATLTGSGNVGAVAFSPDGLEIVATSSDQTVRFWLAAAPHVRFGADSYFAGAADALAFSPDGHTLLIGGSEGAILLTSVTNGVPTPARVTGVAFSPNGSLVATSGSDGDVRLWHAGTHDPARVIQADRGGADSVAFSPSSRVLASGGDDGRVRLWNPATGARLAALRTIGPVVTGVAFSPAGSLLAAASYGFDPANFRQLAAPGAIQVWDTRSRRLLATVPEPPSAGLAGPLFSPDGSVLGYATTDPRYEVVLLSTGTFRRVATWPASSRVHQLAFSPDSQLAAAAGDDGAVTLWQIRTGQLVRTIPGIHSQVLAIAFSPDGQDIAVGSADNLVRIFDVHTGALLAVLSGHANVVNDVAFSPDGHTLASVSADGNLLLWPLNPQGAIQRLCQAVQGPGLASAWAGLHAGVGPPPC